jgi:hypothetical protein
MAIWNILWPFGIFYIHFGYFITNWYIHICSFDTFFPVLVSCTKKNLATLISSEFDAAALNVESSGSSKKGPPTSAVKYNHFIDEMVSSLKQVLSEYLKEKNWPKRKKGVILNNGRSALTLLPSAIGTQSYWLSCCWLKNVLGSML